MRTGVAALLTAAALIGCNKGDPVLERPPIQFGDLHVHSTNSVDVFVMKVPLLGGHGEVKPREHCDFARFCSQLDFWAITDHQEGAPPDAWTQSREAVIECNERYGGGDEPQLVTFAGFEWQQSAIDPAEDWGHKNVYFKGAGHAELPARAIASAGQVTSVDASQIELASDLAAYLDPDNEAVYASVADYAVAGLEAPACDLSVDATDPREDCVEYAADPASLYAKLDDWGFDALVVPHGLTWGAHHPPHFSWRHQLDATHHEPGYQKLVEMYSGHGSMEEYRTWTQVDAAPDGTLSCPTATAEHLPCCWRAGELVAERSETCAADPEGAACTEEVAAACQAFVDADREGFSTVSGVGPEDWLDCGECRDCFQPAEGHRPGGSTQAGLAMSAFDDDGEPLRYRFGFIGSTDTHAVGPGTGYKEFREMSDIFGPAEPEYDAFVDFLALQLFPDWVRQNSYYYSGGLVGVHAATRDRDAIWRALDERRVYATTGERIWLWFDLVNGPDGEMVPMGGSATMDEAPRFRVRAVGSYIQEDGCPESIVSEAPAGYIDEACFGQCYNPIPEHYLIERVEIVRITPQEHPDEPLEDLIADPFLTLPCDPDPEGCTVSFEDPEFPGLDREALYYARVIQEPTRQLNADNLRCQTDEDGACIETRLCMGGWEGEDDDCLAADKERAWASPIYITPP
jgi:hypothetical protein